MAPDICMPYKVMDGKFRPIVAIKLKASSEIRYEVLVDSGADICVFDADIGRAIGLVIEDGNRFELGGITGEMRVGYFHKVTMTVGDITFTTDVGFTDNLRDGALGMVGQKGFFDRFKVLFDYADREIALYKKW